MPNTFKTEAWVFPEVLPPFTILPHLSQRHWLHPTAQAVCLGDIFYFLYPQLVPHETLSPKLFHFLHPHCQPHILPSLTQLPAMAF